MYHHIKNSRYFIALLAGSGAMLCITILGGFSTLTPHSIWLMAPFGATMVILFGLPQSPLAQPKNIILGHILTTAIGLAIVSLIEVNPWSMGLAVGLAVSAMLLTNTTHPPAGANPLVVMLAGESWSFLFMPVAVGSILIVIFGVLYHRMISGEAYPQKIQ